MNITNFRDIGGINTKLGKIQEKRLLRSGELYQLSDADIQALQSIYNLRLILDLRSPSESAKHPNSKIPGARYLNLDVMADLERGNTGFEKLLMQLNSASVDKRMKEIYRNIVLNEVASREYGRFLQEVADLSEGSALFHCFAGKDRTGLGAALLLDTLGATKDEIYADFMMTNTMRKQANDAICESVIKQHSLSDVQIETLKQFLSVKEDYINETYHVIDETYGSTENYILQGLKVTPETLEKIRTNYLQ